MLSKEIRDNPTEVITESIKTTTPGEL